MMKPSSDVVSDSGDHVGALAPAQDAIDQYLQRMDPDFRFNVVRHAGDLAHAMQGKNT